jgi:hypothetical protein
VIGAAGDEKAAAAAGSGAPEGGRCGGLQGPPAAEQGVGQAYRPCRGPAARLLPNPESNLYVSG